MVDETFLTENPWKTLRKFTDARIGIGRAGISVPTRELLAFQLAHAQAQDAVHLPLNIRALKQQLEVDEGFQTVLQAQSKVSNRAEYLRRPDLGRILNDESRTNLHMHSGNSQAPFDLAIAIVDGLSSLAVAQNAQPMLRAIKHTLSADSHTWRLAPICLVEQGRVAIGDDVAAQLNANAVLVMVGERPGLSSPDSLGLYLTWAPKPGITTDAERNCISNVRPAGLSYEAAAARLFYLMSESRRLKLTGIHLKDRTEALETLSQNSASNFLTFHNKTHP